ncbi:MAG: glutamate racemase, partial [Succinivibrio sp.]|nr:glutamate racemase [Succinivibrio sp.]
MLKIKRVLFFDSGVGGLSVYKEVQQFNPEIETYFLFDNAFFPYGEKSDEVLISRIDEVVTKALSRFEFSALVVACNTASTIALPMLRKKHTLPIVGVVPAVKPAAMLSQKGIIGLLATPATVKRQYTKRLIDDFARDCEVIAVGDCNLATVAERKMITGKVELAEVEKCLRPFLDLPEARQPDVIVLGCTHYPHLREEIKTLLPKVRLIDSGEAIGRRVKWLLDAPDVSTFEVEQKVNRAFYTGVLKHEAERQALFKSFGFA